MKQQTIWKYDKVQSRLGFTVTHLLINAIIGKCNNFNLIVVTTKSDFIDAAFELSAEVHSVFTNSEER